MYYKMKCLKGFRDGNVFPRRIAAGETVIVDENTKARAMQSDPETWEVVEKYIKDPREKKQDAA